MIIYVLFFMDRPECALAASEVYWKSRGEDIAQQFSDSLGESYAAAAPLVYL